MKMACNPVSTAMMPATPPTTAQSIVRRRSLDAFCSSAKTQSSTKSRGISVGCSNPRASAPRATPVAMSLSLTFSSPRRSSSARQAFLLVRHQKQPLVLVHVSPGRPQPVPSASRTLGAVRSPAPSSLRPCSRKLAHEKNSSMSLLTIWKPAPTATHTSPVLASLGLAPGIIRHV